MGIIFRAAVFLQASFVKKKVDGEKKITFSVKIQIQ